MKKGVSKYSFVCSYCEGPKSQNSKICQSCHTAEKDCSPEDYVCPQCNESKKPRSKICRNCWFTNYNNSRKALPKPLNCGDCGGPKKSKQSFRCRDCANARRVKRITYDTCGRCGMKRSKAGNPYCWDCRRILQVKKPKYENCVTCGVPKITPNQINFEQCYDCSRSPLGKTELELREWIRSKYSGIILNNDRDILQGREIDIVLPELNLGIEFNGDFWHTERNHRATSNDPTVEDKHRRKVSDSLKSGYILAYVWEWDWLHRREEIESALTFFLNTRKVTPILEQMTTPHRYLKGKNQ